MAAPHGGPNSHRYYAPFNASGPIRLLAPARAPLALKHHPDVGGSHDVMVAINAAAEWLRLTTATRGLPA